MNFVSFQLSGTSPENNVLLYKHNKSCRTWLGENWPSSATRPASSSQRLAFIRRKACHRSRPATDPPLTTGVRSASGLAMAHRHHLWIMFQETVRIHQAVVFVPNMIQKFLHQCFSNISNPSFGPNGGWPGQFSKFLFRIAGVYEFPSSATVLRQDLQWCDVSTSMMTTLGFVEI